MVRLSPSPRSDLSRMAPGRRLACPTEDATPVARDLAASVLPAEMLHEDEIIHLLTKPSLLFIILTSFRFLLMTLLLGVLAVRILRLDASSSITPNTVAVITALVCLGRLIWALAVWTSHTYVLTNLRIVTIKGVFNVAIFQANLRKVQRTTLYMPWFLRLWGLGTIGIATAATEGYDSTWVMIARPVQVHEQILAAMKRMS